MVSPSSRRRAVKIAVEEGLGSALQACRAIDLARSSFYRPSAISLKRRSVQQAVLTLSEEHPRYGYRRITALLRRCGPHDQSQARAATAPPRRSASAPKAKTDATPGTARGQAPAREPAAAGRELGFVEDQTENGTRFRILTLLDEHTRQCLAMHAAWSIRAVDAITVIEAAIARYGAPEHLRSDNGPEFIAYAIQDWLKERQIKTLYIRPGRPWENGHIESFHDKLRDECLNRELFGTLSEARVILESWRVEYNERRPHSALGYQTPGEFARAASKFGLLPASGLLPPKFAKINQTRLYQTNQTAELHL